MNRIAGITSNTVPWEILRGAGYTPRLLEADAGPTPHADRWMEDVFDSRIRLVFDRLCSGAWNHLDRVVIPRTSEQEHKLYLYLREIARTELGCAIPQLYLYNLLHTRTPESYSYGLERTRQMVRDFEVSDEALSHAITESNRARGCVREILNKRREGFLAGSIAWGWLRSFYTEDRGTFAQRTLERLASLSGPATAGPRILIKGAPLSDVRLHSAVEAAGGYVSAEDDWGGSRAAGDGDVRTDIEPAIAIFEKYYLDEMSPRVHPAGDRDAWFKREIEGGNVDGVLFYIPLQDDVVGWDYPRHAAWLHARKIPSAVVPDVRETGALQAFVASARRR